jgi:hypothetical protein
MRRKNKMEEKKNVNKKSETTKRVTEKKTIGGEKIQEKYLPIGTVAMLKGGSKRVMISGFCAMDEEHQGKVWDYSGCMYPEGFLSSTQTCLFDHEQIEKIYHLGLIDDEEKKFKETLKKLLDTEA